MIDPYPEPFPTQLLPMSSVDELVFGLLPCPSQCEGGWLPLLDGDFIQCSTCTDLTAD